MAGPSSALGLAVAAFGLPTEHVLPEPTLAWEPFVALVDECAAHGTLGLLAEAVRTGALGVAPEGGAVLEHRLREQADHDLLVEQALLRVGAALTGAAIEWRAIGPPALAHTTYLRPELRTLDAARVLVDRADVSRSRSTAHTLGLPASRYEVQALPHASDEVFTPPYRFPLAGFELVALPMSHELLVMCRDGSSFEARDPARLRDVAEVVVREHASLVDTLLLARAWNYERELASALVTTWDTLALRAGAKLLDWARAR
jgi:hypothetical protein